MAQIWSEMIQNVQIGRFDQKSRSRISKIFGPKSAIFGSKKFFFRKIDFLGHKDEKIEESKNGLKSRFRAYLADIEKFSIFGSKKIFFFQKIDFFGQKVRKMSKC